MVRQYLLQFRILFRGIEDRKKALHREKKYFHIILQSEAQKNM